jgi:predicted metal-dependent peptidase
MYLEELSWEIARVRVAVDTSGSISSVELLVFMSEVLEILSLYPGLEGKLYFADSALYGPYEFREEGGRNMVRAVLPSDGAGREWERNACKAWLLRLLETRMEA